MSTEAKAQDSGEATVPTDTDFFTAKPVRPNTHDIVGENGESVGQMEIKAVGDEGLPDRQALLKAGAEQAMKTIGEAVARGDDFIVMAQNSSDEGTTVVTGAFHPFTAVAMIDMFLGSMAPLLGAMTKAKGGTEPSGTPT